MLDPRLDATMMNTFVLSHVVPNIRKRLPWSALLVFGKALLRLICSLVADEYIPSDFKCDVLLEWEHVRGADFDAKLNPIKKMVVTVARSFFLLGEYTRPYTRLFFCFMHVQDKGTQGTRNHAQELEYKNHGTMLTV